MENSHEQKFSPEELLAKLISADLGSMDVNDLAELGCEVKIAIWGLSVQADSLSPEKQATLQSLQTYYTYLDNELEEHGYEIGDTDQLLDMPREEAMEMMAEIDTETLYAILALFSEGEGEDDIRMVEMVTEELLNRQLLTPSICLN